MSADQGESLFVYGSLQFPDVLRVLLGRVPPLVAATVEGWHVTALPDVVYPGLLPGGGPTKGFVLVDLSREDWKIVDAFEDPIYDLTPLDMADGGTAWAYTCPLASASPSGPWDPREFAERHLSAYLDRCAAWIDRFRARPAAQ